MWAKITKKRRPREPPLTQAHGGAGQWEADEQIPLELLTFAYLCFLKLFSSEHIF